MILFAFDTEESVQSWHTENDVVMGGASSSTVSHSAGPEEASGALRFSGDVSLENDGGFAQILYAESVSDLTNFRGLELYLKGDDKTYQLRFETDADKVAYAHPFQAPSDWTHVKVAFSDFKATFHGEDVPDAPGLNLAAIRTLGVLIGNDREEHFELLIAQIKAYS